MLNNIEEDRQIHPNMNQLPSFRVLTFRFIANRRATGDQGSPDFATRNEAYIFASVAIIRGERERI